MIATRGRSGPTSFRVSNRPLNGAMAIVSKNDQPTSAPRKRSGSPAPVRMNSSSEYGDRLEKDVAPAQSRVVGGVSDVGRAGSLPLGGSVSCKATSCDEF